MKFNDFKLGLKAAATEEAVKAIYAQYFSVTYNTSKMHDLYTPQVLFEFKYNKNFKSLKELAAILAQALYYIRRLKYDNNNLVVPPFICLADKNEAILTETAQWHSIFTSDIYDWTCAPSKPDPQLVDHLVKDDSFSKIHIYDITKKSEFNVFEKRLQKALSPQIQLAFKEKKAITESNFEAAFAHWDDIIGTHINNGYKQSSYFLANIQQDRVLAEPNSGRVYFTFEDNKSKHQKIPMDDYNYYWDIYEQVESPDTIKGIHAKIDRLTDDSTRRFEGEFFTPVHFAAKAIEYLEKTLGKKWYKSDKFRIWDMAAGTGNLEWHLPAEAYKHLYLSTLHSSEVDHNKKIFPEANCFQYDYLNDDIDYLFFDSELPFELQWKLPKELRDDLKDESLTWLVYINPPFATAQVAGAKGVSKKNVSKTKIEAQMEKDKVGHAKRELFAQFMYRIQKEMPKNTYLGMFSKLKYLNAPDSIVFRDKYFNFKYKSGFVFHSQTFDGVKGKYPIGFLIWDLSKPRPSKQSEIIVDISDTDGINIGKKHIRLIEKQDVINKWFERPKNSNDFIMPPLSTGLTVKSNNKDKRDRARPDFLASICSKGNDFQNNSYVTILSSPSASAGAFTVTPDIFEQALCLHAVRKIPKPTWLNDRNQFLKPNTKLSEEFISDCVVWSLFATSNETTALKDIEYNGNIYQIKNNFFPFLLSVIKHWDIRDPDFKLQMASDTDRFVATWLHNKTLSTEAEALLRAGKEVYKLYYACLHELPTAPFKIETWDAGWTQIRKALADRNKGTDELEQVKQMRNILAAKIEPDIYKYGFLDEDEIYI